MTRRCGALDIWFRAPEKSVENCARPYGHDGAHSDTPDPVHFAPALKRAAGVAVKALVVVAFGVMAYGSSRWTYATFGEVVQVAWIFVVVPIGVAVGRGIAR